MSLFSPKNMENGNTLKGKISFLFMFEKEKRFFFVMF